MRAASTPRGFHHPNGCLDYCGARFYSCKADKNAFALMVQRASLYAKLDEITEFPVDERRVETHNIYIY